jgi:hypothetical protein
MAAVYHRLLAFCYTWHKANNHKEIELLTSAAGELYDHKFSIANTKAGKVMMSSASNVTEEKDFVEFRRKVRAAEILSAAMERLLRALHFTGRVSVVVQNGHVLKSGYEEGYFRNQSAACALASSPRAAAESGD